LQNYSSAQDKLSLKFGKIDVTDFDLAIENSTHQQVPCTWQLSANIS
jgi:hypothetical protein